MPKFIDLVGARESCRSFTAKRPTRQQLVTCVKAARLAPSACNSQPWSFVVVNDSIVSPKVAAATQNMHMNQFTTGCPAFIVVCEEKASLTSIMGGLVKSQQYAPIDIGIATAHLCYAAMEQGLATCIIGWVDDKKLHEALPLRPDSKVKLVVAVGTAAETGLRAKRRKGLDEIMTYIGED